VGTTKEFLGLSEDEHAMVELKLQLANALRTERTKRGLTQAELSKEVGSSQSRVAKMEAGDATVSLDLLVRSLLKIGVTPASVARYLKPSRRRRAA
jgi:transcriptional regulator with XRE-family HTH domain